MNVFKFFQNRAALKRLRNLPPFPRDPETGKFTHGHDRIHIALTPEAAREVHDAAMRKQQHDIAALVEPCMPYGGKIVCTVADRSMMRRLTHNPKVV